MRVIDKFVKILDRPRVACYHVVLAGLAGYAAFVVSTNPWFTLKPREPSWHPYNLPELTGETLDTLEAQLPPAESKWTVDPVTGSWVDFQPDSAVFGKQYKAAVTTISFFPHTQLYPVEISHQAAELYVTYEKTGTGYVVRHAFMHEPWGPGCNASRL